MTNHVARCARQDYVADDGKRKLEGVPVLEACQGREDGPTFEAVQAAQNGSVPAPH